MTSLARKKIAIRGDGKSPDQKVIDMQLQEANLVYIFDVIILSVTANKSGRLTVETSFLPLNSQAFSYKVHSREITYKYNSWMHDTPLTYYTYIPYIIKISQRILKLLSAQASPYKVHSREITQKTLKRATILARNTPSSPDILCWSWSRSKLFAKGIMPTKYYQNISKGLKVIERTSFPL